MYIPKHYHWIFPVAFFMAGFWVWHNVKPQTFDVIIAGGVLMLHGIIYSGYLYQVGVIYQNYICAVNTPDPKPAPVVDNELTPMPEVKTYKPLAQFENVVALPKFDKERNFAVTLLRMHDNFPETDPDMTERKWVKTSKKFIREEDAPTMVEYGLLVALIALVVAIAAALLGGGISNLFTRATNSLNTTT